jgi:hypothetical protein
MTWPFGRLINGRIPVAFDTMVFRNLGLRKLTDDYFGYFILLREKRDQCFFMMSPYAFLELLNQRRENRISKQEFQRICNRAELFLSKELPICP